MSALGCILGATAILITALKWTEVDARQDRQAAAAAHAICSIILYAENAVDRLDRSARHAPTPRLRRQNLQARDGLAKLSTGMRATGIRCPVHRRSHASG